MRLTNSFRKCDIELLQAGFELIGYTLTLFKKDKNKARINDDTGKRVGTIFIGNSDMFLFITCNNIDIGHSLLNHVIDVHHKKTALHIWSHTGIRLEFKNKNYKRHE